VTDLYYGRLVGNNAHGPARRPGSITSHMKKKKPPNQPHADFKNKPFKALKGIVPAETVPAKKDTRTQVRKTIRSNDADDAALFLFAVEGAKRLGNDPTAHNESASRRVPERTAVHAPEDNQLFLAAMQKIGTTFSSTFTERASEDAERRSPTSRMRQLKRGTLRISQELDLHGFLREEALTRLEQFIAAAFSRGQQAVLVITGKGINSPGGPVLQGAVAEWLREKGKGLIAEFSPAPRSLGGSGAFVVFLNK
jgi:DNA-nicking Smr family endonuclease